MYDAVVENIEEVSRDRVGCVIVKRCIDHANDEQKVCVAFIFASNKGFIGQVGCRNCKECSGISARSIWKLCSTAHSAEISKR